MNNEQILNKRRTIYNNIRGIRVGDYIQLDTKNFTRVTHTHSDGQIQTGGNEGSNGYYLGNGYIEYSGGLDSGFHITDLQETDKTKIGGVWFFDGDYARAGGGVNYNMKFRVFKLKNSYNPKWHQTMVKDDTHIIWSDSSGNRYTITKLNEKPTKNSYIWNSFQEAQNVLKGN